ncbi:MAG: hypothetical protein NVS3B26_19640 [Mycobacteriales bacterium]
MSRGVALGVTSLTVAVLLVDVAVVTVAGSLSARIYVAAAVFMAVSALFLAALISRQQAGNWVAALLAWMGLLTSVGAFSDNYLPAQARRPELLPPLPVAGAMALVVTWVWLFVAVALLLLFFPDGRLPGRRWRYVAAGLPVVGLVIHGVMVVSPGPYDPPYEGVRHPFGSLSSSAAFGLKAVLFPCLVVLLGSAVLSLRVRFRRADDVRRTQLKWLALASLTLPAAVLVGWSGFLLLGTWNLAGLGLALVYLAVPVAVTVAILKHNLYEVDRALSAAVAYGVVTAGLLVVFSLASATSGVALGRSSVTAAAAATAVSAVALTPVRRRWQRVVDRRLYPMRWAALRAVDELRLSVNADGAAPEQLQQVLRTTLRDEALQVGYLLTNRTGFVDGDGRPVDACAEVTPITLRGRPIGSIVSAGPATGPLLREVAAASVLLVEMGRLRMEVSEALRDVESSRARLLRLGYEERRRLERDLHDGAQQRLVSLGMTLRLAQRHVGDRNLDVDGLLDEAVTQLGTAVIELREIAHGVRPTCLDDGLHAALAAMAQSAQLPIDLQIRADRAIPDDIATTAYYVVSEAVANTIKHAGASRIGLRIAQADGHLLVRISDDGQGGATIRPGSGLAGIADRVAAAGGSLRVHGPPTGGTVVEAALPCAS